MARLSYVLAHGVKEGLVASPFDWPGVHCAQALVEGQAVSGRWIDRTLEHAALRRRQRVDPEAFVTLEELRLAPLPCWKNLAEHRIRSQARELVEDIEQEARGREHRTGQPPLGRAFVFRQDPRHEPNRLKKGPAPLAHAASRSARDELRGAYRIFLAAYCRAAERLRSGALDALFPEGAFPPAMPYRPAPA